MSGPLPARTTGSWYAFVSGPEQLLVGCQLGHDRPASGPRAKRTPCARKAQFSSAYARRNTADRPHDFAGDVSDAEARENRDSFERGVPSIRRRTQKPDASGGVSLLLSRKGPASFSWGACADFSLGRALFSLKAARHTLLAACKSVARGVSLLHSLAADVGGLWHCWK